MRIGNGLDRVDTGPLASQRELNRCLGLIERAKAGGARVLTGGGRPAHLPKGYDAANRSRYALGATVYTTNLEESLRAVAEIEAGMVWVNAPANPQVAVGAE